jgi:hypothetical protein
VIWLRVGLWVSVLGVEIRNSLDFLCVFFFTFRCYRYSRRYWLLLKFVDVSMGVVNLKNKVVDLLLEELDNRVTLSDYCITLIDLILPVKNGAKVLKQHIQGAKVLKPDKETQGLDYRAGTGCPLYITSGWFDCYGSSHTYTGHLCYSK